MDPIVRERGPLLPLAIPLHTFVVNGVQVNPETYPRQAVMFLLVNEDGRILSELRWQPWDAHRGDWLPPGGKVEPGQSRREALNTEAEQELGITNLYARPLPAVGPDRNDYVTFPFMVFQWNGNLPARIMDTQSLLAWKTFEELRACEDPAQQRLFDLAEAWVTDYLQAIAGS